MQGERHLCIAVRGEVVVVADSYNQRVVRVEPDGSLRVLAGNGTAGYSGDVGPATRAQLRFPFGVDLTPDGRVLVADTFNHVVRESDSTIRTVLGTGTAASTGDGGPARPLSSTCPTTSHGQRNDCIIQVRRDELTVLAEGDEVAVRGGVAVSRDGRVLWANTFTYEVRQLALRR